MGRRKNTNLRITTKMVTKMVASTIFFAGPNTTLIYTFEMCYIALIYVLRKVSGHDIVKPTGSQTYYGAIFKSCKRYLVFKN